MGIIVIIVSVLVVGLVSGLRHHRHCCRPLRNRYNDRIPCVIGALAWTGFIWIYLLNHGGQMVDRALSNTVGNESPIYGLIAEYVCLAFGSLVVIYAAVPVGDLIGKWLVHRACQAQRQACQASMAAAQSCPIAECVGHHSCPAGVKFNFITVTKNDRTKKLVKIEHPTKGNALAQVADDGQTIIPCSAKRNQVNGSRPHTAAQR